MHSLASFIMDTELVNMDNDNGFIGNREILKRKDDHRRITQLAAGYAVAKRKPKKYSGFLFIDSAVPKCEIHLFITSGKVLFIHFDHLVMKLSFATLCL